MVSIAARAVAGESHSGHVRVQVFAGPDADHRALCGVLTMLPDEARHLAFILDRMPELEFLAEQVIDQVRTANAINAASVSIGSLSAIVVHALPGVPLTHPDT